MKNLKQICVTILLACACSLPAWATKYCGTSTNFNITISGQGKAFSCDLTLNHEEGKYVVILANMQMGGQAFYFDTSNMSGWTFTNGDRTAEKRFDEKPSNISFCGWNKDAWGNKSNQIWYHTPANYTLPSAEWEGACAPDDNTPPTITRLTAENKQNKKADIRVEATDAVGVTHVQILNGVTVLIDEDVTPTTSLNQAFTISGLTKNTEYTFTVVCSDAAGNNSTSQNITFTTTNTPVKTVYFVNAGTSSSWAQPYIYYWGGSGGSAFPGTPMDDTGWTNCDGTSIWTADVESDNTTCIFNQGNSTGQTGNKVIFEDQFYNYESGGYGAWFSIADGIYMMGDMTNWTDDKASDKAFSTWTGGSPTYVIWTKRLAAGTTYQFRILHYKDGSWQWAGNTGTITSSTSFSPRWWEMNQYSSGDANNCRITTSIAGKYKFYYDFTANRLKVDYPTPPVGCSGTTGTPTTGSGPRINYSFTYAGGKIYVTAIPTDNAAFDHCYFKYCNNTSGSGEVSVPMTLSADKKEATYELTAPYASGTNMYFKFQYKAGTMGSPGESCSGWNSAPTYNIGNCKPEDDIPYIISASQASATTTSVTLNVSGIVNIDGVENPTTQYVVSTNGGSSWSEPLTASTNQITVTGLTANTVYNVLVKAYYSGESSTNTKTVSANTNPESQCSGTRSAVNYSLSYRLDGSIPVLTITARSNTANAITAMRTHWLTYDNLSGTYQTYHNADENTADHPQWATVDAGVATVTYRLTAADASRIMLLRLGYNIGAGEVWTAGDVNADRYNANNIFYIVGECPAETDPPCMSSVSVQTADANSVVLNVSATDGTQPAPTTFRVSNSSSFDSYTDYGATAGQITVTGLASCTEYTLYVAAVDANGNISTSNTDPSCRYKSVTVTTTASVGNMALHQPATVSNTEDAVNTADKAVDGDRNTRWATGSGYNEVANWIQVDLGSVQVVNSVRIYWENAYSSDYQILFSYDGSNYYSVYHQTTAPLHEEGVYQNHPLACPTPTRYVKVQAAVGSYATDYGLSIWELEVYGSASCAGLASTPHMLCAEAVSVGADEAVIAVSSVDAETAPQNMKYIVTATSGEAGYKQLTSVYTFTASQYIAGTLKHLKVGGLLPDVPYSLSITAVDAAGIASDNSLALDFRTAAGGGACTWEDNEKQDCFGSGNWTEGYIVSIENDTPDNTHFTVTITCKDNFAGLVSPYFQRIPNLAGDACGVVGEQQMNIVVGQERTYSLSVDKSALPDEIDFRCKFAYADGGLAVTKPIHFDKNATCSSGFVIYHYDDAPTEDAVTSSEESSISEPILYYRHFTPDAFEDVTFPFAIDSVRIYDTDDHQYYKLAAQYKDGTTHQGNFYLRVFPDGGSNGESFTNSWEDGTYALPQKNTAYSIRFPNDGGYYANKYILFHGHPGDIATSLSLGTRPATDDLYKVYPNPTMSAQNLGVKAYVTTDRSENLYWKEDNATVQAFETYVLASEPTMKVMRRIAAWSEREDVVTSIADVRDSMAIHSCITVYTLTGQKIGEWHDCSFGDAEDALALRARKGCYILVSEGQTRKMIIQ